MSESPVSIAIENGGVRPSHAHYFKRVPVGATHIDVYRVLELFEVRDPCVQHAVKKLLAAGRRGAGKDMNKDIQEAIDSLERFKAMRKEEDIGAMRPPSI